VGTASPDASGDTELAEAERSKRSQLAKAEAQLLQAEQNEIRELAARDREVRAHEQAHMAVGGQYAGSMSLSYERGPDGRLYAVGGEVSIDTAPVPGDPQATIDKMEQVRRAALAPAEPSSQDRAVAAQAAQLIAQARAEIAASDPVAGSSAGAAESADSASTQASGDSTVEDDRAGAGLSVYRGVAADPANAGLRALA
jgi:SprA-related family